MQLPTINLGGTAREDLLRDHLEAMKALREAISKVGALAPHGRDYPKTAAAPGSLYHAQKEHADRLRALRVVLAEIETIVEHLA